MSWVSPTGFEDPDGVWDFEPNAYDEDTTTLTGTFDGLGWTSFIVLTHAAIQCNKIRYYMVTNLGQDKIDIDVLKDGVWTHVYDGAPVFGAWVEKAFLQGAVTKTRVRVRLVFGAIIGTLNEFDFWEVEAPPPPEGAGRALLPIIVISDWRRNKWLKRRRKIVYHICYA